jgi:hypothetical protein
MRLNCGGMRKEERKGRQEKRKGKKEKKHGTKQTMDGDGALHSHISTGW